MCGVLGSFVLWLRVVSFEACGVVVFGTLRTDRWFLSLGRNGGRGWERSMESRSQLGRHIPLLFYHLDHELRHPPKGKEIVGRRNVPSVMKVITMNANCISFSSRWKGRGNCHWGAIVGEAGERREYNGWERVLGGRARSQLWRYSTILRLSRSLHFDHCVAIVIAGTCVVTWNMCECRKTNGFQRHEGDTLIATCTSFFFRPAWTFQNIHFRSEHVHSMISSSNGTTELYLKYIHSMSDGNMVVMIIKTNCRLSIPCFSSVLEWTFWNIRYGSNTNISPTSKVTHPLNRISTQCRKVNNACSWFFQRSTECLSFSLIHCQLNCHRLDISFRLEFPRIPL